MTGCSFFLNSHGTFIIIDHILGNKKHHTKFKEIEVIQYMHLDKNGIKPKLKNRKITGNSQNTWRLIKYF